MKIEIELPENYINVELVLCKCHEPVPIAYCNIYETGDVWIKTQGCEACSEENKKLCCNKCPMNTPKGCLLHLTNIKNSDKPYHCVINPLPTDVKSWCAIEFVCQKGLNKGKIRKVCEPDNIKNND